MALVLYLGKISSFTEMTHIIENVLNSVYKCVLVEVIVQNLSLPPHQWLWQLSSVAHKTA